MAEHGVVFELFYDGDWHLAPVLTRAGCEIMRGVKSPGDSDPAAAGLTIDNASELYSPRSIASALHGKIGQSTPGRITIDGSGRLVGEVASWVPERPIKGSGWTKIQIAGVLQRIGRGKDPLHGSMRRKLEDDGAIAYWPLEGGAEDGILYDLVTGAPTEPVDQSGATAGQAGTARLGVAFLGDGSDLVPNLAGDWHLGMPLPTVTATGSVTYRFVLGFGDAVWSAGTVTVGLRFAPSSATRHMLWQIVFENDLSGHIDVSEADASLRVVAGPSNIVGFGLSRQFSGRPRLVQLDLATNGASSVDWTLRIDGITVAFGTYAAGFSSPMAAAPYRVDAFSTGLDASAIAAVGHVAVYTAAPAANIYPAINAYRGETAADRFTRLCGEEGITATVVGDPAESLAMGPQRRLPLLDLYDEIARTDDASIFETRDATGLTMRTGASKLNQTPAFTISYLGQIVPNLKPVYGDSGIRNDVTAANPAGATRRVQQLTGPHNIQLPEDDPQGVGRYATRVDVNPFTDNALADAAGWRVNLGTHDGTWYAEVTAHLDAAPGITAAVAALDIGDVLAISSLPVDEALDTVECLIIGIKEDLPPKRRLVTFYCVPAEPYRVGVLAETTGDTDPVVGHLDTDGSAIVAAVAAGAASFLVRSDGTLTGSPLWTQDTDDVPMDVIAGGLRVSISAIGYAVSDAYGRTVASGFGTEPTSGLPYTTSGGSASDYAVAAGVATMAMSGAAVVFRNAVLDLGTSHKTVIVQVSLNVGNAGGATITQWVCGRYLDSSNYIVARLDVSTAGVVSLLLAKRVGGTLTTLAGPTTVGTGHLSGDAWRVRIDNIGSSHAAYAWQGTLAQQPATPTLSATDTAVPTGTALGLLARRESGNTDTGLVVTWDNLMVVNPQAFTVDPSGHQVVYPIPAGSAVNVQQPIILSL